jgi:hypothetical protein
VGRQSGVDGSALEVYRHTAAGDFGDAYVVSDNLLGASGTILSLSYGTGRVALEFRPVVNRFRLGMSAAGVSDMLVVSARPLNGSTPMWGGMTWLEL